MAAKSNMTLVKQPAGTLIVASAEIPDPLTYSVDATDAKGVTRWFDRSGDIPDGYPSVSMSIRKPVPNASGMRNYKVTVVASFPILETLGDSSASGYLPAQKVGYTNSARIEFTLNARSTKEERQELLNLVRAALVDTVVANDGSPSVTTNSPIAKAVEDLEDVY